MLRFDGVPSPDGTLIAYDDKDLVLWIYSIPAKTHHRDRDVPPGATSASRGLPTAAGSRLRCRRRHVQQIRLYHVDDGATVLTRDRTNSDAPAWTPDGKGSIFLSDRNLQSAVPGPWGAYQPEPFFASPTRIYAVALAAGERFPFQPADELHPENREGQQEGPGPEDRRREAGAEAGRPDAAAEKPRCRS